MGERPAVVAMGSAGDATVDRTADASALIIGMFHRRMRLTVQADAMEIDLHVLFNSSTRTPWTCATWCCRTVTTCRGSNPCVATACAAAAPARSRPIWWSRG